MLPPTMPMPPQSSRISNMPFPSAQPSNSSGATMNGFHPNATYYPMQVFYYPTPPISPSIYLQTGQMHPAPMTLVLRGKVLY
jgi:hypothetical protein